MTSPTHSSEKNPSSLRDPKKAKFFPRILATQLGRVLGKLRLLHPESWEQGYRSGKAQGDAAGYKRGHQEGQSSGYKEGFDAGQVVLEIRDHRAVDRPVPGLDDDLFEDWRLPITPPIEARIRADVLKILPEYKQPTPSQWEMILSKTPTTVVVAGAGSGKSTTLILRILLLHHYLGFELDSLTVVTFTNMSRWDFIEKFRDTFLLWGLSITSEETRTLVRTFHSMILSFAREVTGSRKMKAFEFLDGNQLSGESDDVDINPFDFRIGITQRSLLNKCYDELCSNNPRFRDLMLDLLISTLELKRLSADDDKAKRRLAKIEDISARDAECTDIIEKAWLTAGLLPQADLILKREIIQIQGHPFQINGRIPEKKAVLVLGAQQYPGSNFRRAGSKFELARELKAKQKLFQTYCSERVFWIENEDELKKLIACIRPIPGASPGFDYQIDGELSAEPILDCFVGAAGFIENLALDVSRAVNAMKFPKGNPDALFFEALGLFWPQFMSHLEQQRPRVMMFNRMFALFNECNTGTFERLSASVLRPMSHLMIDEFQDISPQIVSWVRGAQREIRRRGRDFHAGRVAQWSSMICVGDDWQSIYGWRGSAPKYFLEFESEFKSPATSNLMLRENYRSHQYIIDAAEQIVKGIPTAPNKAATSAGPAAKNPIPVSISYRDDKYLAERAEAHYRAGESIMILFRRGAERAVVEKLLRNLLAEDEKQPKKQRRIQLMTFHKSKGLEADTVFLLGDCLFLTSSPYKNQAYRVARLGVSGDPQPYDTSQREEIRRLAYVAITRAAKRCYWFIDEPPLESGPSKPKASDGVPSNVPFFHDARRSVESGQRKAR